MFRNIKFLMKRFCFQKELKITNEYFKMILSNNTFDHILKNIKLNELSNKDKILAYFYLSTKNDKINDNNIFNEYLEELLSNYNIFLENFDDFISFLVILNNLKNNYNIYIPEKYQIKIKESVEYFTFDIESDKIIEISSLISNICDNNLGIIERILQKTSNIVSNGNISNLVLLMAKNKIYNENIIMEIKTRLIDEYPKFKDFEKYQLSYFIYIIMSDYEDNDFFEFLIDNINFSELGSSDNISLMNIYIDKSNRNSILIKKLLDSIFEKISIIKKNEFIDLWLAFSMINKTKTNINLSDYINKLLRIKKYNWNVNDLDNDELIALFSSLSNLKFKNKDYIFIIIQKIDSKLLNLEKHQLIWLLKASYNYSNWFSFFFINIHKELEKFIKDFSKKEFDMVKSIVKWRNDIILDSLFYIN